MATNDVPLVATAAATGCRVALCAALQKIRERHMGKRIVLLLSGGVDTAAIIEANACLPADARLTFSHGVAVFATEAATDRPYCKLLRVRHTDLEHVPVEVTLQSLLSVLPFCVKTLTTFDGMTLRNSLVVAMAMQRAQELGAEVIVTGDGADELLGGYSYTWTTTDEAVWVQKRNDLSTKMNFCTSKMASAMGMVAESPYMDAAFVDWVTSATTRADCVGERLIELQPGDERVLHITGKVCLREAFPDSPSAWRRKDPIEVGSGATDYNVSKSDFFVQLIPTDQYAAEKAQIEVSDKVRIFDAEHLYYYRQFRQSFPSDSDTGLLRFESDPCVMCGFQLKTPTENFCHTCGAWPARHTH